MAERRAYIQEMHTRALALLMPKNGTDVNWANPDDAIIVSVADFWEWLDKHVAYERSLVMQHPSQDVTKILSRAVKLLDGAFVMKPPHVEDGPEGVEAQQAWDAERDQVVIDAAAVIA